MTRPVLLAAAAAALLAAAAGQSAHLLTRPTRPAQSSRLSPAGGPAAAPTGAAQAAVRFAQASLACPGERPRRPDRPCGTLTEVDTAVLATPGAQVVVLLTATLHPQPDPPLGLPPDRQPGAVVDTRPATGVAASADVPVALRLALTRTATGWIVRTGAR